MTLTVFQRRNPELLAQYQRSGHLRDRNKIVEFNLPLVRQVANRLRPRTTVPFDDLVQQGSIGLIRAVEAFDPAQGASLSSFAVPFIRGAMQHHLRDNEQPLKGSRLLRDLHQRGQTLQQQRLHQQQPALREAELAIALGCSVAQWQEACGLHQPRCGGGHS
jgi:RNA polymerase sigma-B factor